jgi:hypothetical protein
MEPERNLLIVLRDAMMAYFDDADLQSLCFELGLEYNASQRKSNWVMDIIGYYDHRDQAEVLARKIMDERPNATEAINVALALYMAKRVPAADEAAAAHKEQKEMSASELAPVAPVAPVTPVTPQDENQVKAAKAVERIVRQYAATVRDETTFFFLVSPFKSSRILRQVACGAVAIHGRFHPERQAVQPDEAVGVGLVVYVVAHECGQIFAVERIRRLAPDEGGAAFVELDP